MPTSQDIREMRHDRLVAMLSYWFFLCIVPLVLKKENDFALHHARQGLVLFSILVLAFITSIIPILAKPFYYVMLPGYLVLLVWGTVQAGLGNYARIPVIARLAEKIDV